MAIARALSTTRRSCWPTSRRARWTPPPARQIGQLLLRPERGWADPGLVTHNPELAEGTPAGCSSPTGGSSATPAQPCPPAASGRTPGRGRGPRRSRRPGRGGPPAGAVAGGVRVLAVASAAALTGLGLAAGTHELFRDAVTRICRGPGRDHQRIQGQRRPAGGDPAPARGDPGRRAVPGSHVTVAAAAGNGGLPATKLTVVGRTSPSGPLDDVVRRPSVMAPGTHLGRAGGQLRPGEISLSTPHHHPPAAVGAKLTVTSAPGPAGLTVVGYGDRAGEPGGCLGRAGQIAALRAAGAPAQEQMLYTFTNAGTPRSSAPTWPS